MHRHGRQLRSPPTRAQLTPAGWRAAPPSARPATLGSFCQRTSRPSRKSRETRKIGCPFLQERIASFFGFLRQVVQQGSVSSQLLETGQTVGISHEGRFEKTNRRRALLQNLPRPLHSFFLQPF